MEKGAGEGNRAAAGRKVEKGVGGLTAVGKMVVETERDGEVTRGAEVRSIPHTYSLRRTVSYKEVLQKPHT